MISKYLVIITLLCFSLSSFAQNSILFIGNSLTYFNEMPQTFNKVCELNNKDFEIKLVAFPGYSLYNHLTTIIIPGKNPNVVSHRKINKNDTIVPEAIKQLKSQKWDYIYLQDRESGEDSIEFAIKYIRELAPNSKIKLFQNYLPVSRWSKKYNLKKKKVSNKEIKRLAKTINAEVIPVSSCFEKIRKNHPANLLYDETEHPTAFGSLIIAVFCMRIFIRLKK